MRNFLLSLIVVCIILILQFKTTHSQPSSSLSESTGRIEKANYKKEPMWIKMMEDPKVNYFEALKAYNQYWEHHELGGEEEEEEKETSGEIKSEKEIQHELKEREEKNKFNDGKQESQSLRKLKKVSARAELIYKAKLFRGWMLEVKPFLKEDGTILSEQEIVDIWKKQQTEIMNMNK